MKSSLHFMIIVPYAMTQSSCHLADSMQAYCFFYIEQNFSRDVMTAQGKVSACQRRYNELAGEVNQLPDMLKKITDITDQIGEIQLSFFTLMIQLDKNRQ